MQLETKNECKIYSKNTNKKYLIFERKSGYLFRIKYSKVYNKNGNICYF